MSKNQKSKVRNQAGVSLLELILAIAVFVVGSASVAHLFIGAQTSATYSVDKTQAILLAKEGIEEVRATRSGNFDNLLSETTTETIALNNMDFERVVDTSCSEEVCIVESTVGWESIGREESVSFTEHLTAWMEGEYVGEEEEEEEEE